MSNRTDIVVETDNAEGQVLLSASRVYDLTEDKTQDTINSEAKNTLNQLGGQVVKDQICVKLTATQNRTSSVSITGMTADHVLDSIQFYSDNDLLQPIGIAPFDVSWITGAGTLSITVANKAGSTVYVLLSFSYKPNMETITI